MIKLFLTEIEDQYLKENFIRLNDYLNGQPLFNGIFRHFEIRIPSSVTNFKFVHNLGFKPNDVIQTSAIGSGNLTWNYDKFDAKFLDITTTGPVTVRAFIGAYKEG